MRPARRFTTFFVVALLVLAQNAAAIRVACGLEGIADWGKSLPFKNVMKMCRNWQIVSASSDWDYPHGHLGWTAPGTIADIPLRPDGYPLRRLRRYDSLDVRYKHGRRQGRDVVFLGACLESG